VVNNFHDVVGHCWMSGKITFCTCSPCCVNGMQMHRRLVWPNLAGQSSVHLFQQHRPCLDQATTPKNGQCDVVQEPFWRTREVA